MIIKALFVSLSLFVCKAWAFNYPTSSITLSNGLKVIVCEKPGNNFVEFEVWYKTGSKDEIPGIRGMAHLFEHMMFRGTEKYPANSYTKTMEKIGGNYNAYTTFDRTVYHQYIPVSSLELIMDMESDRMQNLKVTQAILNTEREVVGEEYRNGINNWYQRMNQERYPALYPQGHPYEVDVIGHLDEITSFTEKQCMDFFNSFYSPNNAFLVIVGNVKAQNVFVLAEKYFGPITKQLDLKLKQNIPDVFSSKIKTTELSINFPVQIYSYVFPKPEVGHPDFFAMSLLSEILFTSSTSILNNRLVKNEHLAYSVVTASEDDHLYPNKYIVDVIMGASLGNAKVKKIIREEISKVVTEGISQAELDKFISSFEASNTLQQYKSDAIANQLGMSEFYHRDFNKAKTLIDEYKKIALEKLMAVASQYLSENKLEIINIKPSF
jgi:zinc protease